MRCDECRYWTRDEDGYRAVKGIGLCKKAVELWDATEWVPDADGEPGYCDRRLKADLQGQMSFVQDGSDYAASLWTTAEFFCAHFSKVS